MVWHLSCQELFGKFEPTGKEETGSLRQSGNNKICLSVPLKLTN